jgi:membrane protease YdiL (CAAX protease family)
MSSISNQALSNQERATRAVLSILLPAGTAVLISFLAGMFWDISALSNQAAAAVLLSSAAVVSLLLGIRWYGISGMGMRGGRALTAGLGFASLLWIIFIVLRFFFVDISPSAIEGRPPDAGRTYIYLLLFEALATQIWTYGLVFHAVTDWRGPVTAIFVSGLIFGLAAILLFQESFSGTSASMIYFIILGFLYAIIRLRTGSFLGTVIVQSVQSFTTWIVLAPYSVPDIAQLNNLYLSAVIAYMIVAWRLWPKQTSDYRI